MTEIDDLAPVMSFRDFVDGIKEQVQVIGDEVLENPEDDWIPVSFFEVDGKTAVMSMGEFMSTEQGKNLAVKAQLLAVDKLGAKKFAMVVTAWMAVYKSEEGEGVEEAERRALEGKRPSEHPDREEAVVLQAIDAERVETWIAKIERHEDKPPTLKPWEGPNLTSSGRFVDEMRERLR